MKLYAAFLRDGRWPVLLPEGFSVWAFLFGPLWLLIHAAWIPGLLLLALDVVLGAVLHGPARTIVGFGLAWLVGLHAQDWRGWSLKRRGWRMAHMVAARDADSASVRLLEAVPDYRIGLS